MTILLDNGHGKNTPGKRSPYSAYGVTPPLDFHEWEFNREIARRLLFRLQEEGFKAMQIVPEERDVSLSDRVRIANAVCDKEGAGNVLLISIHADAFGDGKSWNSANGWSCYTTPGRTKSDSLAECLYASAQRNFPGRKLRKDLSDGDSDKEENFYILKHTKCPAVLTENFFYTNEDDCSFIRSEAGKAAVVKAHLEGIKEYIEKYA